jgi:hypothetical protein
MKKKIIVIVILLLIIPAGIYFLYFYKPSDDLFKATGNDWNSPKRIEDYFVNDMKMSPEEAQKYANVGVSFYVTKNTTLDGIINNLTYYGLVRDEKALRYALEHTNDTTSGKTDAIKVGNRGSIDSGIYELSRNMDTWQIADTLLNKGQERGSDPYNYLFMPGDPNAPHGERPIE